ncbi:hypothetical protein C5B31_13110 [Neisseria gonorrhoeae]|nr:hypothetical protein C5B31_13110 [Neisseria gonorrhoeae]
MMTRRQEEKRSSQEGGEGEDNQGGKDSVDEACNYGLLLKHFFFFSTPRPPLGCITSRTAVM